MMTYSKRSLITCGDPMPVDIVELVVLADSLVEKAGEKLADVSDSNGIAGVMR